MLAVLAAVALLAGVLTLVFVGGLVAWRWFVGHPLASWKRRRGTAEAP